MIGRDNKIYVREREGREESKRDIKYSRVRYQGHSLAIIMESTQKTCSENNVL